MASRSRIEFADYLKQGLLRKVIPSFVKADKGLKKARVFLHQARKAFDAGLYDSSLMTCYQSIFLAAKSVLLKDGYREKSHACVARYLEERYAKAGILDVKWIELLDRYRDQRHQDEYDVFFFASKDDCRNLLKFAGDFIDEMDRLISKKSR